MDKVNMNNEVKAIDEFVVIYNKFQDEISKVIVGQKKVVKQVFVI